MFLGQRAQALRPPREKARRVGQADAGMDRSANASICAGSRTRCMDHLAKPGAMMFPRPARVTVPRVIARTEPLTQIAA